MTQEIDIPTWKWAVINMDFITGLPRTRRQHDSIGVIVDRMTKSSHFLEDKTTYLAEDYAKFYLTEIMRLHGFPLSIISRSHLKKVLILKLTLLQDFIHGRMGRQSVPFRP